MLHNSFMTAYYSIAVIFSYAADMIAMSIFMKTSYTITVAMRKKIHIVLSFIAE